MASYRNTYEVLIASPSDLSEERSKIVKAICEWNFENSNKEIAFLPLLWEWNAVSNFDQSPQAAINEQLLNRADFIIAAFKGRMGTPTQDYPAGTIEELSKRKGQAAVFFPAKWLPIDVNDPKSDELIDQFNRLKAFKKSVSDRFPLDYQSPDDLLNKVKQTLTDWAQQRENEKASTVLSLYRGGPYNPKKLLLQASPEGEKACVLLYNTELRALKTKDDFEASWGFLKDLQWVEKVVLLLPRFKVDRLKQYLCDSTSTASPELLGRFSVCLQKETVKPGPLSISSSLSFALLRYGSDPTQGTVASISQLAVLAEPFASAKLSSRGGPDLEWEYKYYIELNDPPLQEKLAEIWDQGFQSEGLLEVSKMALDINNKTATNHVLEKQIDYKTAPICDVNASLIRDLRHKLFDPNVPSYLLNAKFELLDWNSAFELIFPTTHFYRHESVREFVECLANKDEIKRRGAELIAGPPRFDLEQLAFRSPKYGAMNFTKIASMVKNPQTGEPDGWIVALNVNQAEHWGDYEEDLRRMNGQQALIGEYSVYHNRILGTFPGYLCLIKAHVTALANCQNILDLGCGPGILSEELLKNGKRVTAIDQNDAMIDLVRERCKQYGSFSSAKANLETLHKPDPRYSFEKVGIRMSYDAAALHNVYYWLQDPPAFLRRLADEDLIKMNGLLTISLLAGKNDADKLLEAIQVFRQNHEEEHGEDFNLWNESDFESFSSGIDRLVAQDGNLQMIGRYGEEDVAGHLVSAGYAIIEKSRPVYTVQGLDFCPFAFFVAKRIR